MGWQEARQRYRDGSTLNDQKTEDLVARRVLKGLGLVERQIGLIEYRLFGEATQDTALWPRTYAVLRAMAAASGSPRTFGFDRKDPGEFEIEVREVGQHHEEILEMLPLLEQHVERPHPVFLTRVRDTVVSRAYLLVDPSEIETKHWTRPPINFLAEAGRWWLACIDTERFIAAFGPYRNPLED